MSLPTSTAFVSSENSQNGLQAGAWKTKGTLIYQFCPEKRPLGPYLPSLRNVKLQNDPLVVVWMAVSEANGPRPKHAPKIILAKGD